MQFSVLNLLGAFLLLLLLLPNLWYARRGPHPPERCTSKILHITEQVGRYACMLLLVLPLGIGEFGFPSVFAFLLYLFGNGALLLSYWLCWLWYFQKPSCGKAVALALLPTGIFLLSGITLRHPLLLLAAVVFGISHLCITLQNNC